MAEDTGSGRFFLITGRTPDQTKGMHSGKTGDFYRDAVSVAMLHPETLEEMGVTEGAAVLLKTEEGQVTLPSRPDKGLPRDIVFVPMGPTANRLIPADTGGCGMPSFKGIRVEVSPE